MPASIAFLVAQHTTARIMHGWSWGRLIQSLRAFRRTNPECLCIGALVIWCLGCCCLHCPPTKMANIDLKMGCRWLQEALTKSGGGRGQALPGDLGDLVGPILGPSWVVLGLPWSFLGGPGGHLEANLGLRRAAVGIRCGSKVCLGKARALPGDLGHLVGPILDLSWAVLGPPRPFLGGPRGHLEANLGLRRAAVGMRCG